MNYLSLVSRKRCILASLCTIVLVFAVFVSTAEAWVPWTNSSGTGINFDWANGGSDNGLYGNTPTLSAGNTFLFFPSNFRADAADGGSQVTSDRLEVDLSAHTDWVITSINIVEYGQYGISGTGSVAVTGQLDLENLDTLQVLSNTLLTNPSFPVTSGSGQWNANGGIAGFNWSNLTLELNNSLSASAGAGSTAQITKDVVGLSVAINTAPIPEPGTVTLLGLGLLALVRRRG